MNIPIIAPMTRESLEVARRLIDLDDWKARSLYWTCGYNAWIDMSDIKPAYYVCRCNRNTDHLGPHAMFDRTTGELRAIWPNEAEAR